MMTAHIVYRAGYKYQLHAPYNYDTGIRGVEYVSDFLVLQIDGVLRIAAGYAWDGPSGPTYDTTSAMRGSLVHDALYQLMRAGHLPNDHRLRADELLYRMCREDGMGRVRAWAWYRMVRWFASGAAAAQSEPEIYYAP